MTHEKSAGFSMAKSFPRSIEAMPFYRSGPVPSAVAADAVAVDHQRLASATRIRDIDEALIRRMFGGLPGKVT